MSAKVPIVQVRSAKAGTGGAFSTLAKLILIQLAPLFKNSQLYDPQNEIFEEPVKKLLEVLGEFLERERGFRFEFAQNEVYVNRTRLRMDLAHLSTYRFLAEEFRERGLGGAVIEVLPALDAVRSWLRVFAAFKPGAPGSPGSNDASGELNDKLGELGISGVEFLPEQPPDEAPEELQEGVRERAITTYEQALDFIRESIHTVESPEKVSLGRAKRIVHKIVDLSYEEGAGFSLAGLASIKSHDEYTFNHIVNVCVLAVAFGQRLGFSKQRLAELGLCALYHDIGKMHIPLEILNKQGSFTDEEWSTMGNHTIYAARTLLAEENFDYTAIKRIMTALQHHLRYDGSGYPKLKILKKQTLFTRVTAIVDTYDAMTTKRIYQRQYLPHEAMQVLQKGAGTMYDPILVKAFVNCMGIYPIGSLAVLCTGELAVVVEANADPAYLDRPKIKIITDAKHALVQPRLMDLSCRESAPIFISKIVDPEEFNVNVAHFML